MPATITTKSLEAFENDWQTLGPQAVPTSADTVVTVDAALQFFSISNQTSGAITITLSSISGSTGDVMDGLSVPGNSIITGSFNGMYVRGGLKWQASATGLVAWVKGRF